MRINELSLMNFRCFEERTLEFAPSFNLVVGENGKGKTSLLEGASTSLCSLLSEFPEVSVKLPQSELNLVRRKFFSRGQSLTSEPQFPCSVKSKGVVADESGSWDYTIRPKGGAFSWAGFISQRASHLQKQVQDGTDVVLPVISHYGTERLWIRADDKEYGISPTDSRFAGYRECLNTASNHQQMVEWFKKFEFASLQQNRPLDQLEACRRAVVDCVPNASHFYFDVSHDQLILKVSDDSIPFNFLSDGFRNILALVADIAVKCSTLNPHLGEDAPSRTPGVVLIDELDLHLHPKWQRRIIFDLMRVFPNVQFVATTHSPFVIQSLPAHSGVRLINLDDDAKRDASGRSVEDIAEAIQGVELPQVSQPHLEMMNKATSYYQMLDDDSCTNEERQEARKELEVLSQRYSDNPAYHAFIRMQELVAEKKRQAGGEGAP